MTECREKDGRHMDPWAQRIGVLSLGLVALLCAAWIGVLASEEIRIPASLAAICTGCTGMLAGMLPGVFDRRK